jgi:hypothetical protein
MITERTPENFMLGRALSVKQDVTHIPPVGIALTVTP